MATVETKIFKHHKKADCTYNIKVRVTHKREKKYLDTPHFISDRQLTAKLAIKDIFLKKIFNDLLDDYRTTISELGENYVFTFLIAVWDERGGFLLSRERKYEKRPHRI